MNKNWNIKKMKIENIIINGLSSFEIKNIQVNSEKNYINLILQLPRIYGKAKLDLDSRYFMIIPMSCCTGGPVKGSSISK